MTVTSNTNSAELVNITRLAATNFKIKAVLEKLSAKKVARARREYAQSMGSDETPLVLADTSIWTTGSKGMMITDRRVYTSAYDPIELSQVIDVDGTWAKSSGYTLGNGRLMINGVTVLKGQTRFDFLKALIPSLASTVARGSDKPNAAPPLMALERSAADCVAKEWPRKQILDHLASMTGDLQSVGRMADMMAVVYRGKWRKGALYLAGGVFSAGCLMYLFSLGGVGGAWGAWKVKCIVGAIGSLAFICKGVGVCMKGGMDAADIVYYYRQALRRGRRRPDY